MSFQFLEEKMKRKFILLLLALVMIFTLVSCPKEPEPIIPPTNQENTGNGNNENPGDNQENTGGNENPDNSKLFKHLMKTYSS